MGVVARCSGASLFLWGGHMAKERKAYQCEYGCGFYKLTKKVVIKHERTCFYNPERKACASCGSNLKPNHDVCETKFSNWCEEKEMDLTHETLTFNCAFWKPKG